jgi:Skp family chaperone for outer membrane proteins
MKKIIIVLCFSFVMLFSFSALAGNVGVVDMQKVFSSSKAKAMRAHLKSQFSSQRKKLVSMQTSVQKLMQKYQKNEAVMDKKTMTALQNRITKKSMTFHQAQTKFQHDLLTAENAGMKKLMAQVKAAAKKIAAEKHMNIVLPSNAVLYSQHQLNITNAVLSAMK